MTASERMDPKLGPFSNLSQACFSGFDLAAKGYEPVLRTAARWNLELVGLATRRVRAWSELPGQIAQCRTPQDFAQLNVQYWQTAAQHYSEGARQLTALAAALAMPGVNGAWVKPAPGRDYITFPEPKAAAEEAPGRDRRAA